MVQGNNRSIKLHATKVLETEVMHQNCGEILSEY